MEALFAGSSSGLRKELPDVGGRRRRRRLGQYAARRGDGALVAAGKRRDRAPVGRADL